MELSDVQKQFLELSMKQNYKKILRKGNTFVLEGDTVFQFEADESTSIFIKLEEQKIHSINDLLGVNI